MYCDRCGTQLQEGQRFCGSCGKPLGVAVVQPLPGDRIARHIHLLGVLWLVVSALHLIGAAAVHLVGHTIFGGLVRFPQPFGLENFLRGMMSAIALWLVVKSALGFVAAWGLFQREVWARPLTLVLGFLELLHVPFGTALGIYTIWVLMSPNADQEYRQLSRAA